MAPIFEVVQFKTLDGLTLVGRLYSAEKRGPSIIMTPGFNCVKEMFLPEVAEQFQAHGITALIYDPRSLGESEGEPRNDINPILQMSDYSDALTFMKTLPMVDPDQIAFWGQSFAGCIALCAAALDRRAKTCIAICPLVNFDLPPEKFPQVLVKSMRDRESRAAGNMPIFLPVLTEQGKNPAGMGIAEQSDLDYLMNVQSRGAPNYENRTTLQTYYNIIIWQSHGVMKYLTGTPVLMVVPELDRISSPAQQMALFETFPEPKQLHVALGKGHLNVLSGENLGDLCRTQAEFVQEYVNTARGRR